MDIEEVRTIAVLGAGTMGHSIAQVTAQAGYNVVMRSRKQTTLDSGLQRIRQSLQKLVEKERMSKDESEKLLSFITTTTDLKEAVRNADVIIETIIEDMEVKKGFFKEVSELCKEEAILTSNTSTLTITEIASATDKPEKVVGTHFFNPLPLMKPIEIVKGVLTSDDTVELVKALARRLDKIPVVIKDSPGFASTRLGVALFMEASRMLEEGVASVKDIDMGTKLFYGHRMGPFETCDIIGLDSRLHNLNSLHQATGDLKWVAPLLLKQLVAAGYRGKKPGSKGGYYAYFGLETDQNGSKN
jgi:3-hydroxybutyryl-CoA dehydrogenase